jgi:glycosyltransferase involved in cell wall biosynthesis
MGEEGRRHVLEHFTWDRIAVKTLELYRSLT